MTLPAHVRERAERLFVEEGWPYHRIAGHLEVAKSTLVKWGRRGGWQELRAQHEKLSRVSMELFLELARTARDTADPQQVFAAMKIGEMLGLGPSQPSWPRPRRVAEILLDAIATHPELAPLVRRYRREVVERVAREVERLEGSTGPGGGR